MVNKTQTGNHASQKLDNGSHMFVCLKGVCGGVGETIIAVFRDDCKRSANLS